MISCYCGFLFQVICFHCEYKLSWPFTSPPLICSYFHNPNFTLVVPNLCTAHHYNFHVTPILHFQSLPLYCTPLQLSCVTLILHFQPLTPVQHITTTFISNPNSLLSAHTSVLQITATFM